MPVVIVIVLFALVLIAGGVLLLFVNNRRTREMQALARTLNLQFLPQESHRIFPFLTSLDFFSRGKYKKISNLMMGQLAETDKTIIVAIFDYSFTLRIWEDGDQLCQSTLLFFVENMNLPQFRLRPHRVLDKLGNAIGMKDILFPKHPEFSQRYRLSASQEADVRRVFRPLVIEFLEDEQLCLEAQGPYLILYPAGYSAAPTTAVPTSHHSENQPASRLLQIQEIPLFLEVGKTLLKLLLDEDFR